MDWLAKLLDPKCDLKAESGLAANWETCAFGEARTRFPGEGIKVKLVGLYQQHPEPADDTLHRYGVRFYQAVKKGKRASALEYFFRIQKRAAKLANS